MEGQRTGLCGTLIAGASPFPAVGELAPAECAGTKGKQLLSAVGSTVKAGTASSCTLPRSWADVRPPTGESGPLDEGDRINGVEGRRKRI